MNPFQIIPTPQQLGPVETQNRTFNGRRAYSRIGAAMSLILIVWLLLSTLLDQAVTSYLRAPQSSAYLALIISDVSLYLVAIPLGYLILRTEPLVHTRPFTLSIGQFFTYVLMMVPITYAGNILGLLFSALFGSGDSSNRVQTMVMDQSWIMNLITVVILAPLVEEWLFRKQLIGRLRRFGERPAIIMSALMFGLFHMNLYQFFYAFGVGLLFGYVYTRTSRLRYSIGLHMLMNLNGAIIAPWVLDQAGATDALTDPNSLTVSASGLAIVGLYGVLMLAACIAGIVCIVRRWRLQEYYVAPEQLPQGTAASTMFGNPGVIVYVVIGVLATLAMLFLS